MTTKRGSITNHGILKTGSTLPIIDEALEGNKTFTRTFTIDTDTVIMGLIVRSVATGGSVSVKVYTTDGSDDSERREVLDMGLYNKITPSYIIMRSQLCLGMIRVEVSHTTDCDIRLVAKPSFNKDGDARQEANDVAALALEQEKREWRTAMLNCASNSEDLLKSIRNHLREVTEIEDGNGELY